MKEKEEQLKLFLNKIRLISCLNIMQELILTTEK